MNQANILYPKCYLQDPFGIEDIVQIRWCDSTDSALSWIEKLQSAKRARNQSNLVDSEPSVKNVSKVPLSSKASNQFYNIESEPRVKRVHQFVSLLTSVIKTREMETLARLRAMVERSKEMKVRISLMSSNLRMQVQLRKLQTLFILKAHSSYLVQSDALTAAESLAGINEQLLEKIDLVPLRIGLTNLKSVVDKADYKFKLRGLDALRTTTRVMRRSGVYLDKAVISQVKPNWRLSDATLKRAIEMGNTEEVERHIIAAQELMNRNQFTPRDFSLLINSLSKAKDLQSINREYIKGILGQLELRIKKNPAFVSALVPLDTALIMNGIGRFYSTGDEAGQRICGSLMRNIAEQIPTKLPLFQDHHLAMILHALSKTRARSSNHIAAEIVREIDVCRDLDSFTPQSVVMIAYAISSLQLRKTHELVSLWKSIFKRVFTFPDPDFQPKWPGILLRSVAYSKLNAEEVPQEFAREMVKRSSAYLQKRLIDRDFHDTTLRAANKIGTNLEIVENSIVT